jgi:hypothetical protein
LRGISGCVLAQQLTGAAARGTLLSRSLAQALLHTARPQTFED